MGIIDDIHRDFDRRLGVNTGAGGVAAQRKHRADLDGLFLRESATRRQNGNRGGAKQPDDMPEFHADRLREVPPDARLLRPGCAKRDRLRLPLYLALSTLHAGLAGASSRPPARALVASRLTSRKSYCFGTDKSALTPT